MAEFPFLPLWTDAYLADTAHLTEPEHGRYLLMLIHLWRAPGHRFPNDDDWLARKFRCSVGHVQEAYRPLIEEFFSCDGNWIKQKRLEAEFARVSKTSKKQSVRSKSRWEKEKTASRGNATHARASRDRPQDHARGENQSVSDNSLETNEDNASRGNATSGNASIPIKKEDPPYSPPEIEDGPGRERATKITQTWRPSSETRAWAKDTERLPAETVQRELTKFVNHYTAAPGPGGWSLDWNAKFRNWLMNAKPPPGQTREPEYATQWEREAARVPISPEQQREIDLATGWIEEDDAKNI